jgi:hypothetical protein
MLALLALLAAPGFGRGVPPPQLLQPIHVTRLTGCSNPEPQGNFGVTLRRRRSH